jgi:D-alanine-D-alanine ligase
MDKWSSKRLYEEAGLLVPPFQMLTKGQAHDTEVISRELGFPVVVKPRFGGSSIGTTVVQTPDALPEALGSAYQHGADVILEAYIDGTEVTGGVLGNEDLQLLPVVEIIPESDYAFFDYEAKYTAGATREICPARIDEALSSKAQSCAATAHRALCCHGYSRTDMIIRDETIYVLETNTIPGMTPVSLFPLAAKTAGISFGKLLDRLIELALEGK